MAAYFVAIREAIFDPDEMKIYGMKAKAAATGVACVVRAAYGRIRTVEGEPAEGLVIMEFPTFEAAEAWYDGSAYREAVQHRFRGAEYRSFIVDGM